MAGREEGKELLWQLETTWRSGSVQGRKGFVRLHLTLEECEGRNCSGIENDVAQWKRTGQKGICAFASDAGKKRDQLDETKTQ